MEINVTFFVYSRYIRAENKPNPAKFDLPLDRVTITELISIIYKNKDDYYSNPLLYLNSEGVPVPLANSDENSEEFMKFVQEKAQRQEPVFLIKPDLDYPVDRNIDEYFFGSLYRQKLDIKDVSKIFCQKVNYDAQKEINTKLEGCGFTCKTGGPRSHFFESKELPDTSGTLSMLHVSAKDAMDLLKTNTSVLIPLENGEYVLSQFIAQNIGSALRWHEQERGKFSCYEVTIPVTLRKDDISYELDENGDPIKLFKRYVGVRNAENESIGPRNPFHCDLQYCENERSNFVSEREPFETLVRTYVRSFEETKSGRKESNVENPAILSQWLTRELEKFKNQLIGDVQQTVKETLKNYNGNEDGSFAPTSKQTPKVLKTVDNESTTEVEDRELIKLLNTLSSIDDQLYPIEDSIRQQSTSNKRNKTEDGFSYSHSQRRRLRELHSQAKKTYLNILKRGEHGRMVELGTDLFVSSKVGFKIKMAPNSTTTLRLMVIKYGRYRSSRKELELQPYVVPNGVECCVKPVTKCSEKSPTQDKNIHSYYDVRFKTKDKTGKFRCYFNILDNNKVCGSSLRIDIRVKRLYFNSDLHYEGPGKLTMELCKSQETTAAQRDYSTQKLAQMLENARITNPDLPDEGIGGNQEDLCSASSDSDDVLDIVNEPKGENANDEGIDTRCPHPYNSNYVISDEDTDSSVSLLLDEDEVREKVDEDSDIVKISSCFVPSTDITKETVPSRIKRKMRKMRNSLEKRGSMTTDVSDSNDQDYIRIVKCAPLPTSPAEKKKEQPSFSKKHDRKGYYFPEPIGKGFNFSTSPKEEVRPNNAFTNWQVHPEGGFFSRFAEAPKWQANANSDPFNWHENAGVGRTEQSNHFPNSYFDTSKLRCRKKFIKKMFVEPMKCGIPEIRTPPSTEAAGSTQNNLPPQQEPFSSMYPNLGECPSFFDPFVDRRENGEANPSIPKETPTAVPILPEKVFEVTGNVFKSVFNTVLPHQQQVAENVQRSFNEAMSSISRSAFNNETFASLSHSLVNDETLASISRAVHNTINPGTSAEAQATQTAGGLQPMNTTTATSMETEQITSTQPTQIPVNPVVGEPSVVIDVGETVEQNSRPPSVPSSSSYVSATAESAVGQKVSPEDQQRSAAPKTQTVKPKEEIQYNELPFPMREQLLRLNEMGFMNDSYNIFLLRQYPNNFDSVIESLINYNA